MNELYKSLFIEKISSFVCFIKYRSHIYTFEKPFFLDKNLGQPLLQDSVINLIDGTTNKPFLMHFDDILMFHIQHENNPQKSLEEFSKTLADNNVIFSQFKFLKPRRLHDLFFRTDLEEQKPQKIRNIKILDTLYLDDLDDYTKLFNGDGEIINQLKSVWQSQITKKLNDTLSSLDEEIKNASDESVVEELQAIKDILSIIPKESEEELSKRKTIEGVLEYWPTLLLPRSTIFDIP